APPAGALTAHASRVVITPGSTVTLTASFANNGLPDLAVLSLLAQPPAGWTAAATSDTTFSRVRSGQSVQASWQVTAPPGASPRPPPSPCARATPRDPAATPEGP